MISSPPATAVGQVSRHSAVSAGSQTPADKAAGMCTKPAMCALARTPAAASE